MNKTLITSIILFKLIISINGLTLASTVDWSFYSLNEGESALSNDKDDINKYDIKGRFPLIWAAKFNNNPQIIDLLVKNEARVDMRDREGLTPLMYAAKYNINHQVIDSLLRNGANPNTWSYNEGKTPLIFAAKYNNHHILKTLIEGGANINEEDFSSMTPLMHGVSNEDPKIIDILIESGADPNTVDLKGRTALIWASISNNDLDIIKRLLEVSDPKIRDNSGNNYLDYLKINPYVNEDDFMEIKKTNKKLESNVDNLETPYNLRLRPWNTKRVEIINSEPLTLVEGNKSKLRYNFDLEGYKLSLNYFFDKEERLNKIEYIIPYDDQYLFKSHYLDFLERLTDEYGDAKKEDLINLKVTWEKSNTLIKLYSKESSNSFEIVIEYERI
ncbi:ankyrin repeat domain-containing protein [Halonatronum saccharophilum]|uniref:ankyrin repeat domain-containing protein n=1 Tax=Halonatronum saccharophilum TaxID=150060 RepID=UPI0004843C82|nr:ankyrin repeat domain-containing protein [Halonatronum saccharophilum]